MPDGVNIFNTNYMHQTFSILSSILTSVFPPKQAENEKADSSLKLFDNIADIIQYSVQFLLKLNDCIRNTTAVCNSRQNSVREKKLSEKNFVGKKFSDLFLD